MEVEGQKNDRERERKLTGRKKREQQKSVKDET